VHLIGTGDFTHPLWLEDLKSKLKPIDNTGIFSFNDMNFILTSEVSTIYPENGVSKKVHHNIHASSFEIVDQINEQLKKFGRLESDGRPILSLS